MVMIVYVCVKWLEDIVNFVWIVVELIRGVTGRYDLLLSRGTHESLLCFLSCLCKYVGRSRGEVAKEESRILWKYLLSVIFEVFGLGE